MTGRRRKTLSIPWEGVRELFHSWSGKGELFAGLAAVRRDGGLSRWSARDIERRAHRVLFLRCLRTLQSFPTSTRDWLAVVPVHSQVAKVANSAPQGRVDWATTRRSGWPPREFASRTRSRTSDETLLSALRWTVERVLDVFEDARKVRADTGDSVEQQLSALRELAERPELQQVDPVLPDPAMIRDLRRSGARWRAVADLADLLRKEDSNDLVSLAESQIAPDPDMCEALFHLGVFGLVLGFLRSEQCETTSLRPLLGGAKGAAYEVVDKNGQTWALWFEAADLWGETHQVEPYVQAASGLKFPGRTKSPDILLINHHARRALIVECKYSKNGGYIREGYEQVLTYLTEARTTMIDAGAAFVVAPSEMVTSPGTGHTHSGPVTFCAPEHLKAELGRAFADVQKPLKSSSGA